MNVKLILKKELIGKKIKIIKSKNKANKGVKGKIIDETLHTLIVEHNKKKKRLLKNNIKFEINTDGEQIIIDGKNIIARPEDRVKLKVNK